MEIIKCNVTLHLPVDKCSPAHFNSLPNEEEAAVHVSKKVRCGFIKNVYPFIADTSTRRKERGRVHWVHRKDVSYSCITQCLIVTEVSHSTDIQTPVHQQHDCRERYIDKLLQKPLYFVKRKTKHAFPWHDQTNCQNSWVTDYSLCDIVSLTVDIVVRKFWMILETHLHPRSATDHRSYEKSLLL